MDGAGHVAGGDSGVNSEARSVISNTVGLGLGLSLAVGEGSGVAEGGGADVAHPGGVEGDPGTVRLGLPLPDDMGSAAVAGGLGHHTVGADHGAPGPLELAVRLSEGQSGHTGDNQELFHVASDRLLPTV